MSDFKNQTLLVTGAAGKLGRIVVDELLARGATKVIAGTRDPQKLAEVAARGVEIRKVDFDDAATLAAGFAGVDRVLIISTDGIGKRVAHQSAAVGAAKAAGVKHIVYTSAPAARPNADAGISVEHFWTELAIANSGLGFTVLRNHMYAENNLGDAARVATSGQLFGLIGDRGTSYVTRADAGRAAAGALLSAEGQTYEDVTGPAPVTNTQRAEIYAGVTGKPVQVIAVPPADYKAGLVAAGVPEMFAEALLAFQRDAVSGHFGVVTDAVERLSGRKPQAFADFVAQNRAAFTA